MFRKSMVQMFSPFFSLMAERITSTDCENDGFFAGVFFLTLVALIGALFSAKVNQ